MLNDTGSGGPVTTCQCEAIAILRWSGRDRGGREGVILLYGLLGEGNDLFFGLALVLRKRRPLANDLSPRLVKSHIHASTRVPVIAM